MIAARIGALCYLAWGLLHAVVGGTALAALARGDPALLATVLADRAGAEAFVGLDPAVLGLVGQHATNLLSAGLAAAAVAAALNWRNSLAGFWVNAVLVSVADLGFLAFVVAPGHMSPTVGAVGPGLWLAGLLFTAAGCLGGRQRAPALA